MNMDESLAIVTCNGPFDVAHGEKGQHFLLASGKGDAAHANDELARWRLGRRHGKRSKRATVSV